MPDYSIYGQGAAEARRHSWETIAEPYHDEDWLWNGCEEKRQYQVVFIGAKHGSLEHTLENL
jgi:hypothetical protein